MLAKKKRPLTLLEVVIAIALLGAVLTGLFNTFYQSLKSNISAQELKQELFQLELFQQKIKTLLIRENGVWLEEHSQAEGLTLSFKYEEKADPDFEMCGQMQGMLFLNSKKELCLAHFSETGKAKVEILLDRVDAIQFSLFDTKKKEWSSAPAKKEETSPAMVRMDVTWNTKTLFFPFFLKAANEKIVYTGTT